MTAQNTWNLGGAYSHNETPSTGETYNLTYAGIGFTRQFQPRLSGTLGYRMQQKDSNVSANSYTEHAVFASLKMGF